VDFGLAKMISRKSFSFCGSLDYMAPEIIKDEGHSFEVDFYAVGNLLFEILVGSPPFYHPKFTTEQTKYHILNTEVRYPDYLNLSNSVIDLMSQLLHKEPMFRLGSMGGINEILSHHWFNSVNTDAFMSKSVTPPITMEISLVGYNEDDIQNKKMWESLLQKDIKQAELRESMRCTKTAKGNRHRSLDSQKSCEDKSTDKVPKGV
jgi:serine/threonine protein kinase